MKEQRIFELLDELRELTRDLTPTKNEKVPKSENLAASKLNKIFDIDIFYSRKPGMRRSVQLITSGAEDSDYVKLSCLTALASLCDTMIANKQLNVSEEDIVKFMVGWMDMHHIKIADLRKNS